MTITPSPFRPVRWIAHLPLVILPFLAAIVIQGPGLGPELMRRAEARLLAAGQGWAKLAADGRDLEIKGVAPSRAAAEAALAAVSGTFGVRRVDLHVRVDGL